MRVLFGGGVAGCVAVGVTCLRAMWAFFALAQAQLNAPTQPGNNGVCIGSILIQHASKIFLWPQTAEHEAPYYSE